MKICLINSLYSPDTRGGAERIVEESAKLLSNSGHEVFIVATSSIFNIQSFTFQTVNGIRVYRVSSRNLGSFYNYTNKPLWFRLIWLGIDLVNPFPAWAVKRILKKENPDVVHVHNMRGLSYLLPKIIHKLNKLSSRTPIISGDESSTYKVKHEFKIPPNYDYENCLNKVKFKYVQTLHDIQYAYPSGLLIKGEEKNFVNSFFLRALYEKFCIRLLGSPDVVISPSRWLMEFYVKRGFFPDSRKEVFGNPMATISNEQGSKIEKEKINLLFVGQMEIHKGIYTLLEAVKKLPVTSYQLLVTVIGSGSQLEKVRELTKDDKHISVLGDLPNNKVMQHFQKADIFVMPTLTYENQPTVVLEAFSRGVPVIASNLGGISEMVSIDNGWLFEAGNAKELSDKIKQSITELKNADTSRNMSEQCIKKVQQYNIHRYKEMLEKLYK